MEGDNDSTKSIIAFAPVVNNSLLHGAASGEDMGLRKRTPNCHGPERFGDAEFSGDIKLDKVRIISNCKAGGCIGLKAKAKIGLDEDAVIGAMDAEHVIPGQNCSSAGPWTWRNIEQRLFGSISFLYSKIKDGTIPSDQTEKA